MDNDESEKSYISGAKGRALLVIVIQIYRIIDTLLWGLNKGNVLIIINCFIFIFLLLCIVSMSMM